MKLNKGPRVEFGSCKAWALSGETMMLTNVSTMIESACVEDVIVEVWLTSLASPEPEERRTLARMYCIVQEFR